MMLVRRVGARGSEASRGSLLDLRDLPGRDTYAPWREGVHDDLLFSLAVAVWWGEWTGGPHLPFLGPVVGI